MVRFLIAACTSHRRIVDGAYTAFDKRYMVYFVQSHLSKPTTNGPNVGDYWLCGGAIVSPTQILTAAACLLEHNNIYAIAGYKKYVKTFDLENDECTRRWKQKVVKICTPKDYKFDHSSPMNWLSMDIGVAIVEKPYNFSDLSYRLHCSYAPYPIKILYEEEYQSAGNDVLMLGWGHKVARQPHNIQNLNSPFLREASGLVQPKSHCRTMFHTLIMEELVDKYMICVHHKGHLGGNGELLNAGEFSNAGCMRRNMDPTDPRCANNTYDTSAYDDYYDFRRNANNTDEFNEKRQPKASAHERFMNTRRQGICQNDHGGPLVTWVGREEVLIGVALTSLINSTYACIGPYLFCSTYCTSMILQCLLVTDSALRAGCEDKSKKEGYIIDEKTISWRDVNSERKPAETDFKPRQVKPLHQLSPLKDTPPQPPQSLHSQPVVQLQPDTPSKLQPNIRSESHYAPWSQQPNVISQPRHDLLRPQRKAISRPHASIPQPQVPLAPNPVIKILENEYAKIKSIRF